MDARQNQKGKGSRFEIVYQRHYPEMAYVIRPKDGHMKKREIDIWGIKFSSREDAENWLKKEVA